MNYYTIVYHLLPMFIINYAFYYFVVIRAKVNGMNIADNHYNYDVSVEEVYRVS